MKSSNALSRTNLAPSIDAGTKLPPLSADAAQNMAGAWMNIAALEDAFTRMPAGILSWQIVPPAQNAMAAALSDMIADDACIYACGLQAYGWMMAARMNAANVMRMHLGKILPVNVMPMSAEDISMQLKKGPMTIVALHVDSDSGWNDVRAISAAAVKAECPLLLLVTASIPAPAGVALDVMNDWNDIAPALREAAASVAKQGAIRVVAVDDMPAPAIEMAMMQAAQISPQAWNETLQKNSDGAEAAMNIAYQSPVESF